MPSARDTALPQGTLLAQSNSQADTPLLKMEGVTKRFGENTALSRVDFDIRAGEIHALLGENGAGKSTLMHVLSGLLRPDSGSIMLNGSSVRITSPQVARKNGIAMVHQHFALVPAFTVAENLALDTEPYFGKRFSLTEASRSALERAHALGWNLDPSVRVSSLPIGTQQRIEIVKALATNAKLLIFDEPTAVLSPNEVAELFTVLRRLRDEGNGVILIAHKLAEIMAVADRVTVLRRGVRVTSAQISDTNPEQLAEWMIGEKPTPESPLQTALQTSPSPKSVRLSDPSDHLIDRSSSQIGKKMSAGQYEGGEERPQDRLRAVFQASRISVLGDRGETAIQDLNLELHAGEIYGVAGVDGNGQTELAEALTGLRPLKSGTLTWRGEPFDPKARPITGYIPQDRRRVGLAVTMSVEDNLLFDASQQPKYRKGFLLNTRALRELAANLIEQFDIRTSGANAPASSLSGGNQQKIVVARALHNRPEWIVAMNPTRGLDIGATRFVHNQLRKAKAEGATVLLISTDLDEVQTLADRSAILSAGRLTEVALEGASQTDIGLLLGGVKQAGGVE